MKGILSSKLATGMLMLAAFMANIFATMPVEADVMSQCCQKSYGITQGSRFRNLHGRIAITPRNLQYLRTDHQCRRLKLHLIIIAY